MVKAGVFGANEVDVKTLATDRFVNKGVGVDLPPSGGPDNMQATAYIPVDSRKA
jgi:hypothetical protein